MKSSETYEGRLELTWTNKHLRLLAHEDGSYQWVPPADYRVAEVRLLHDVDSVGNINPEEDRAKDNLLVRGDALSALTSLVELPEFAREYVGKVKLAYLDPPFNTQQAFEHYDDALEHSVWLTMMRDRLLAIKTLLSPDGSVWVHCDDSEQAYLKVMMDEVFGRDNFVASVVWEKVYSPRMDVLSFSSSHDYILVYAKSNTFRVNGFVQEQGSSSMFTQQAPDGRRYRIRSLRKDGKGSLRSDRPNLYYGIEAPDGSVVYPVRSDGREGRWRWERATYDTRKDEIEWIMRPDGYQPYVLQYEDEARLRPPETIWPYEEVGSNHEAKSEVTALFPGITPFETPKPERLLERVLHIGSEPGDVVLDCFLGWGTTAAVAHKMGRRWIAVEWNSDTLDSFTIPRLAKVVEGNDPGGITKSVEWQGGGAFRILEVAPSMFTEAGGQVFLSDWATDEQLAEATAAQLHFDYKAEPPFYGHKGRSRLAVIDGLVNEGVVQLLVGALSEGEGVVICGTAVDPKAEELLRDLRPGSTVRKIPQSLLRQYRQRRRWLKSSASPSVEVAA